MTTFHDLARRADSLTTPPLDVDALVAEGDRRVRRRRLAAVATAAAAVVVIIAGGVLLNSGARQVNAPIDRPDKHDKSPAPTTPPVRRLVYADGVHGQSIHFGSRVVRTGVAFTHIDVTDDGFVYSTGGYRGDGRLWFSDGGTPVQIGSHACEAAHGFDNTAITSNSGSRIVWLECTRSPLQSLVVFDTSSMREVVRQPLPPCEGEFSGCGLDAVLGDHVYLTDAYTRRPEGPIRTRILMLDLTTSALTQVSATDQRYADASSTPAYLADVRGLSRGLVLGETPAAGTPTDGIGEMFSVVGSRLAPRIWLSGQEEPTTTTAFDLATGRPVELRLPQGYDFPGRATDFQLFEWLDDHTVAFIAGGGGWAGGRESGDLLTCRLTDGRCELAARGREGVVRVVPHLGLPG